MSAGTQVQGAARSAADSTATRVLARTGFAASGLVHLGLGYVAIRVALHHAGRSDRPGRSRLWVTCRAAPCCSG